MVFHNEKKCHNKIAQTASMPPSMLAKKAEGWRIINELP